MSHADDCYEQYMIEQCLWNEDVERYIKSKSLPELFQATRRILAQLTKEGIEDEADVVKIRSILIKGIANQYLSERQKYALGDFVLTYEEYLS